MGNIFSSNNTDCNLNSRENDLEAIKNEIRKNYYKTQNGSHSVNFEKKALGKNEINKLAKEIKTVMKSEEKNTENKIFKFIFSSSKKIKDRKSIAYINKKNHESLLDKKRSSMSENKISKNFK